MSLQQERERATQLQQDLAAAKREVETQTALARGLSMAHTRSNAYQEAQSRKLSKPAEAKPESGTIELRKSLQRERNPAEQLERALVLVEHLKFAPFDWTLRS